MPLVYNNTQVNDLYYNNTKIQNAYYNGTLIYSSNDIYNRGWVRPGWEFSSRFNCSVNSNNITVYKTNEKIKWYGEWKYGGAILVRGPSKIKVGIEASSPNWYDILTTRLDFTFQGKLNDDIWIECDGVVTITRIWIEQYL